MQQATYNLVFYRGDSRKLNFWFEDEDTETGISVPSDLTNVEIRLQGRYDADDPTPVFELPWIPIDNKKGSGYFNLSKTVSENLLNPYGTEKRSGGVYDIQFWSKLDPELAHTPLRGTWTIQKDVTRRK
ncbi:hypothetical protein ACJ7VZ_06005 [Aeromonas salmonicida]|uniref:hypothetical protein n=1 Tax=Aeromonas salmonicida TaxID=645 RepID=UPI0038B7FDB7